MKKILVLGGGGFIGGHLSKRLKDEGHFVRAVDIKNHEYFTHDEICNEFILGDLTDPKVVSIVIDESFEVFKKCIFLFYPFMNSYRF